MISLFIVPCVVFILKIIFNEIKDLIVGDELVIFLISDADTDFQGVFVFKGLVYIVIVDLDNSSAVDFAIVIFVGKI